MVGISAREGVIIGEYSTRLFKGNRMLPQVRGGLPWIPVEAHTVPRRRSPAVISRLSPRGLLDSNGSWRRRRRRDYDRRGNLLAGTQAVEIVSPRLHHLATLGKALRLVIRRAHFIAF